MDYLPHILSALRDAGELGLSADWLQVQLGSLAGGRVDRLAIARDLRYAATKGLLVESVDERTGSARHTLTPAGEGWLRARGL